MRGPAHTYSISEIGGELRALAEAHPAKAKLALFAAAHRARAAVVEAIGDTPNKVKRHDGSPMPAPADMGELVRSGKVDRTPDGAIMEFTAAHAAHMDLGTRPHTPPYSALLAWAIRKLRVARKRKPRKVKPDEGQGSPVGPTPKRKSESELLARAAKRYARAAAAHARDAADPTAAIKREGIKRQRAEAKAAAKAKAAKAAIEGLARRAWNSIRRHGTEPRNFYARASQHFGRFVDEELKKRLGEVK